MNVQQQIATPDEIEEFARLQQQAQELHNQIEQMRPRVVNRARMMAMQLMEQYGFTADQILETQHSGPRRVHVGAGEAKYRDPASGKTWSGLGKRPRWIVGKNFDDFLIDKAVAA